VRRLAKVRRRNTYKSQNEQSLSGLVTLSNPHGADPHPPPPLPLRVARQVEIIERGNYPLLPTGIGEGYNQKSNLGHATLLRRCELPL
jgi:hypothetical protein